MSISVVGPLAVLKSGAPLDPKARRKWARKQSFEKRLDGWEARIEAVKDAPLRVRCSVVMAILFEMAETPAFAAGNDSNPVNQGKNGFSGDGAILKNMVVYALVGFVISIILKYMGRGELAMMAIIVTGVVVLRQFVFIIKELWGDVTSAFSM